MSKIKNGGLDQHGAEPYEQQQFGTAGVEWVKTQKCPKQTKYDLFILDSCLVPIRRHVSSTIEPVTQYIEL